MFYGKKIKELEGRILALELAARGGLKAGESVKIPDGTSVQDSDEIFRKAVRLLKQPRQPRKVSATEKQSYINMRTAGYSTNAIAKKHDRSISLVLYHLKKAGKV